jgi:hypothetical protein
VKAEKLTLPTYPKQRCIDWKPDTSQWRIAWNTLQPTSIGFTKM